MTDFEALYVHLDVLRINSHKRYENGQLGRVLALCVETRQVKVYWYRNRNGRRIGRISWIAPVNLLIN